MPNEPINAKFLTVQLERKQSFIMLNILVYIMYYVQL